MNQVHSSSLSAVKSVFSNEDENVFFYDKLRDVCGTIFLNVEFAEPVLNQSSGLIVWKALTNGPYENFKSLSDTQKENVGAQIKEAFQKFQEQTASLTRQSAEFQQKFLEIPSENSIYVNLEKDQTVITEWGFLLNQLNPPSKVMEHLFPADEYSIVVELLSSNGNPLVAHSLRLSSNQNTSVDETDDKGLARLGQVLRGESFTISSDSNSFPSQTFVSKRTNKYTIIVPEYVYINVRIKNGDGTPVVGTKFMFKSEELGVIDFTTDELGECTIRHLKANQSFSISDSTGKQLHTSGIPNNDVDVEIVLENVEAEPNPTPILEVEEVNEQEAKEDVVVKFRTWFGRPKKQLPVTINQNDESEPSKFVTDDEGQVYLRLNDKQTYSVAFSSFGEPWTHQLTHDKDVAVHSIGIRPIFPWLWWLLILILLILLWFCAFDNCLCECAFRRDTSTERVINDDRYHDGESGSDSETKVDGIYVKKPVQNCRAHFSGLLVSDEYQLNWKSEIWVIDESSEYVGEGDYPRAINAFPKSDAATFDGIAIDKGTRVIIYELPDFKGGILLDEEGPVIVTNKIRLEQDANLSEMVQENNSKNFRGDLNTLFPPHKRIMSSSNMFNWSKGSLRVICNR